VEKKPGGLGKGGARQQRREAAHISNLFFQANEGILEEKDIKDSLLQKQRIAVPGGGHERRDVLQRGETNAGKKKTNDWETSKGLTGFQVD